MFKNFHIIYINFMLTKQILNTVIYRLHPRCGISTTTYIWGSRVFQRNGVMAVIQIWSGVYPTRPRPLMNRGRQYISEEFDVEMINPWAASLGLSNRPLLELPSHVACTCCIDSTASHTFWRSPGSPWWPRRVRSWSSSFARVY